MIVRKLLPIKSHFFFFMAALGPILPQLQVFGKEMGISSIIMGTITGILPFAYLLAKPLFGVIVDLYRDYRKAIFMGLILIMAFSYSCLIFVPVKSGKTFEIIVDQQIRGCDNMTVNRTYLTVADCSSECSVQFGETDQYFIMNNEGNLSLVCALKEKIQSMRSPCTLRCKENIELPSDVLLISATFWCFVVLLSVGTIAFNVVNSISDAICFDVIGDEYDYGKQRTWAAIGYGVTALLSGYSMDNLSFLMEGYKPAVCIMMSFIVLDLLSCLKLKLPIIPVPENIWTDLRSLMQHKAVSVFLIFTIVAGTVEGFLSYFLLWYVEDITKLSDIENVKLLEGFIIAAGTFGGNILFFYVGDNILKKIGHVNCFSTCFLCYAIRLGLISIVSSPWSIVIIEFLLQGPSFALTYLTIVAYANDIAPSGTSATMQGIAAGLDDGLGFAFGSILGGILYRFAGPRRTFQIFCCFSVISGITHHLFHRCYLQKTELTENARKVVYTNVPQK